MLCSRNAISSPFGLLVIVLFIIGGTNAKPPSKIQGGQLATGNEFADVVSLASTRTSINHSFCGGVVIGPRHILTAGHCVDGKSSSEVVVRAGAHDYTDANVVKRFLTKFIRYPQDAQQIDNTLPDWGDLAILVLAEALPTSINAIKLATHQPEEGVSYFLAGWGATSPNSSGYQYHLKILPMTLHSAKKCESRGFLPHTICAYSNSGSSCGGDSGSPLVRGGYLYGTGHASNCEIGEPTGFVNVYEYVNWINGIIQRYPY